LPSSTEHRLSLVTEIGNPAGRNLFYELGFSMRSFLAILLMLVALWQVVGGHRIDMATATLAIAAAWFLSLFLGD